MKRDERDQLDRPGEVVRAPDISVDHKPSGYDASAQAGLIKGYVLRLPREECLHVMAAFLRGRERARARRGLVGIVLTYIDEGWDHKGLVLRLMAKHYGQPGIFLEDLADRYRIKGGRRAVSAINREVVITLDSVAYRAETKICDYLQKQGVIQ
mgnify:FL=1